MLYFNAVIGAVFVVLMALGYGYFIATGARRSTALSPS